MPSLRAQATNLVKTARDVAVEVARSGQVAAHSDIIQKRLKACGSCNYYSGSRCSQCGCYVNIKVGIKAAVCPVGKWRFTS